MSGKNVKFDETVKQEEVKKEFLTESDKYTLDSIKLKRELAIANAEKAELMYSNVVLQLTLKYSLKEKDAITEQGEILRG